MENELKTNAVKLSSEEQYQIRKSIVRLSKKEKQTVRLQKYCTHQTPPPDFIHK